MILKKQLNNFGCEMYGEVKHYHVEGSHPKFSQQVFLNHQSYFYVGAIKFSVESLLFKFIHS